jgi:hypothetical protein
MTSRIRMRRNSHGTSTCTQPIFENARLDVQIGFNQIQFFADGHQFPADPLGTPRNIRISA